MTTFDPNGLPLSNAQVDSILAILKKFPRGLTIPEINQHLGLTSNSQNATTSRIVRGLVRKHEVVGENKEGENHKISKIWRLPTPEERKKYEDERSKAVSVQKTDTHYILIGVDRFGVTRQRFLWIRQTSARSLDLAKINFALWCSTAPRIEPSKDDGKRRRKRRKSFSFKSEFL